MNRFFALLFLIFGSFSVQSQIHEIGIFLGGSNYVGDIGPTNYIAPNEAAVGILYKWNRSPRHSWRVSLTHAKITSSDKDSDLNARKLRNYDFENTVTEVSAGLEFDFFKFDLHDSKPQFTPYVYSGLSYLQYDGLFFVADRARSNASHGSIGIPMTLGVKGRVFGSLVVGLESSVKYTFADDIDGSGPSNKNLTGQGFGNTNSNDWVIFTGVTLTYTFGNKPCFCAE